MRNGIWIVAVIPDPGMMPHDPPSPHGGGWDGGGISKARRVRRAPHLPRSIPIPACQSGLGGLVPLIFPGRPAPRRRPSIVGPGRLDRAGHGSRLGRRDPAGWQGPLSGTGPRGRIEGRIAPGCRGAVTRRDPGGASGTFPAFSSFGRISRARERADAKGVAGGLTYSRIGVGSLVLLRPVRSREDRTTSGDGHPGRRARVRAGWPTMDHQPPITAPRSARAARTSDPASPPARGGRRPQGRLRGGEVAPQGRRAVVARDDDDAGPPTVIPRPTRMVHGPGARGSRRGPDFLADGPAKFAIFAKNPPGPCGRATRDGISRILQI